MSFLGSKTLNRVADVSAMSGLSGGRRSSSAWAETRLDLPEISNPGFAVVPQGERRACGNPECTSAWTMPWRNRKRPIFEGSWGCCGRCVLAVVRAAVRREQGDGPVETGRGQHRHRVPLGLVLLAQGWITHPQLQQALQRQRAEGEGRIGDWLVSECGLNADQITRGLSVQWSCPVLPMTGFRAESMALVAPRILMEEFGVVPLRVSGGSRLYLGFEGRLDASVALGIETISELKTESGVMVEAEFACVREELGRATGVTLHQERASGVEAVAERVAEVLEQQQPAASRMVRVHQYYWVRVWLEKGSIGRAGSLPGSTEDVVDYLFTTGSQD